MKFGETFAQRSVPEWAVFNLNYNGIKDMVKRNTSTNHSGPISIPQQGQSRWEASDQALFDLLKSQHENIALFLKMKHGEVDRRLKSLTRQIASLRTYVDEKALEIDVVAAIQGRKYRKLSKEAEDLGDLIQKVARFASAQKIAFRKLLKKYKKWTGSTALQARLDSSVFSAQPFKTDYSDYLQELAEDKTILSQELAVPMLRRQQAERLAKQQQLETITPTTTTRSIIAKISDSIQAGHPAFAAAIMSVPYGEAAGSAMFWIHPDNLDEARTLLHKTMKRHGRGSSPPSRAISQESLHSRQNSTNSYSQGSLIHAAVFDNAQRLVADKSPKKPSKIALSAYWNCNKDAAVTLNGLSPTSTGEQTLILDCEDLVVALDRDTQPKNYSAEATTIQKYLIEHRDVKPLALIQAYRNCYSGQTNNADVASWATLDTDISVGTVYTPQLGETREFHLDNTFPFAVLHIRWEFTRMPAVVRAFDESHLAFRVHDFTTEEMAVYTVQRDLPAAPWQSLLSKDITKLPLPSSPTSNRMKTNIRNMIVESDISGTSSGPSSSEGQADSVFSTGTHGNSSVTSEETRTVTVSPINAYKPPTLDDKPQAQKKHARVIVPELEPTGRYWNEFDDGDSDVNVQDAYAIYIDPNEPDFPYLTRAWAAVRNAWPIRLVTATKRVANERTPLLYDEEVASIDSSDSDSFMEGQQQQMRQGLVWRLVVGISVTFLVGIVLAFCIFTLA